MKVDNTFHESETTANPKSEIGSWQKNISFGLLNAIVNAANEDRPFTNADRIRAMTDEELAKWLVWHANPEIICEYEDFEIGNYSREYADALDWLKQEAT